MNKEMQKYFEKHVKYDNSFCHCDSKKVAIIISLIPRTTVFEDAVYYNGEQVIQYIDTT